ncbi:MAG TPA: lipid-A-disaccharide synthase, partial [Saprospiraceae bacterium]|nr:lipid-A-disaccharide synthase [Saprospiraceae bacterium]
MKYFLIAGELSGDQHGARLIIDIIHRDPTAIFYFWGGDAMSKASGQKPLKHCKELAFMGFKEVILNLSTIYKNFKIIKSQISLYSPDVVVFIDYPGFNLRLAPWVKKQNMITWYYISPTVWAWKSGRKEIIRKYIDRMMVIFPFEVDWYKSHGIDVEYQGNPSYESLKHFQPAPNFINQNNLQKPYIALIPGSRAQEINNLLPIMLETAQHFSKTHQIVIAKAQHLDLHLYTEIIKSYNFEPTILENATHDIMYHAQAALITSGTATLEAAILGLPHVVCYKTSSINYFIAKLFVKLEYIGLPNIIMNTSIVPEFIQNDCTVAKLQPALQKILN